jgi:hypothetical protein
MKGGLGVRCRAHGVGKRKGHVKAKLNGNTSLSINLHVIIKKMIAMPFYYISFV